MKRGSDIAGAYVIGDANAKSHDMTMQLNRWVSGGQSVFQPAISCLWLAMLMALPGAAGADDALPDRFAMSAGAYYVRNSATTLAFSPKGIPLAAGINLSRDLGLEESDGSYRIDGYYRFGERHRLDFAWYRVDRTGSATISDGFEWDGQEYFAGWTIGSRASNETVKVNYLYSLYRSPEVELGLGAGLHMTRISSGLKVTSFGNILPPNPGDYATEHTLNFSAPLPVVGVIVGYQIAPRWKALWSYDAFYLQYGGIRGDFSDANLVIEYQAFRHFGIGAGFNRVQFDLEGEDEGDRYSAVIRYDAYRLYIKGYF